MNRFVEHHRESIRFEYACFDRILLNAIIQPLQQPAITTAAKPSIRIAGSLDANEDPRDLYRIWVPAHRFVRAGITADGSATARIWGPRTVSVDEGFGGRRRDLRGQVVSGGALGFAAYVEVRLTSRTAQAHYVLSVRASSR